MEGFQLLVLPVEDLGGENVVGEVFFELEEDLIAGDRFFGAVDHDNFLFDLHVGDEEDGALGHGLEVFKDDALDLMGADLVAAAGFDHVVFAGDEVNVALLVGVDVVAAGDDDFVDELPLGWITFSRILMLLNRLAVSLGAFQ